MTRRHGESPWIFLSGAVFFWLLGCASYQEASLSSAGNARDFASRSLQDEGLVSFLSEQGAAKGRWTLNRLALAAVYFHGDMAVAKAGAEESSARMITAGERPNPVFSFSPGYNSTTSGISPWIISPVLDLTIETAGKRQWRMKKARSESEAARLRISATAWAVWKEVRAAMLELYASQRTAALLKSVNSLQQEQIDFLSAQVDAGESAPFELTLARQALSRDRLNLQDAETRRGVAYARLASAVGIPSSSVREVSLDFSVFDRLPPYPGPKARKSALINRADLLAALADYAVADADLRLEIARQYPDIHLSPGYELDQTDNKWLLGFAVEIPIFNQHQGAIAEAVARRKKMGKIFEAKQAAVFGEIEKALADYRGSLAKVTAAKSLASEAGHALSMTKKMVDAGEVTRLDLIRSRIESGIISLSLEAARIEAQKSAGTLQSAIQMTN